MRSGAAVGHAGYFHETAFYGSDGELLDVVVPFLEGGRAAGEPTLVALDRRNTALVRGAMDVDGIRFLPGAGQYDRPAATIRAYRHMLAGLVAAGAEQIRVVGDVPHPGSGAPWQGWARYEAVVNHAYDAFPLWGLCPYDTRTTPADVLEEVALLHQHVATPDGGHTRNDRYVDPASHLAARGSGPADPLLEGPPAFDLRDPTSQDARIAVAALGVPLERGTIEDLVAATSEVVSNALRHGRPPVRVRGWVGPDRVVVLVHDGGGGPADPFVGLLQPDRDPASGGLGLWIAHQLCSEVALSSDDDGFDVLLVAGAPFVR